MSLNVRCAASGCTNPVIGQCAGYADSCGRFYCAAHSTNGLCSACANRKLEDELAQRTYVDHLQTAKQLQRELNSVGLPAVIGVFGVCGLFIFGIAQIGRLDGGGCMATFFIADMVAVAVLFSQRRKREEARLEQIRQTKPAFPEFYRVWKKDKTKEALMIGLTVAGAVAATAVAAAASSSEKSREDDRIRNAVDDELSRRGIR